MRTRRVRRPRRREQMRTAGKGARVTGIMREILRGCGQIGAAGNFDAAVRRQTLRTRDALRACLRRAVRTKARHDLRAAESVSCRAPLRARARAPGCRKTVWRERAKTCAAMNSLDAARRPRRSRKSRRML